MGAFKGPRDYHLSDDKAVANMGALWIGRWRNNQMTIFDYVS